ncbi:hypothetical protein OG552_10310 [Streptomyces sp. NBC_01476]|uniref:zinc finger domain-containing protein n=1 Tax=Streptomyces sp. NBC_01476 TaxID=2903881 RepID=UPI002E2FD452|nr:hypothetical protein [Streptomyces sp. NBC_01476]
MNPSEAAELLKHCSAFDNRKPSAAAAVAWAAALNDVPFDDDASAAVATYYTTAPKDPDGKLWILPHHVRTLRAKIRSARVENFQYEPVEGETAAEFIARYQGQIRAVASGRVTPPASRLALEGGPSKQFVQELEARGFEVGRPVPDSDEQAVIDSVRRAGPLGVECPACGAVVGRPCKTPGGTEKQPLGKPRLKPHSARLRAAVGELEQTPAQRLAEEERRREASRVALVRLTADEEIVDAEIVESEMS